MINRKDLTVEIEGFLNTLSDEGNEEWYDTDRKVYGKVLDEFVKYLYQAEDEKEARYAKFVELYAEFGEPK